MQFLRNLTAYTFYTTNSLNVKFLRRELYCGITGMYSGKLDVLRYSVCNDLTFIGNRIHFYFLGMFYETAYNNRVIFWYIRS